MNDVKDLGPQIPDPILITGAPRSGTSMVAGIVHLLGSWGGDMIGPHPENPKGFFENTAIKEGISDPYLFSLGYDLLGKRQIPPLRKRRIPRLKQEIKRITKMQGYEDGPWFFKSPMMCLISSAWIHTYKKAKWIIVRREIEENAQACIDTSWMHGLSGLRQWIDYVGEYNHRMDLMFDDINPDFIFSIWPQKIVDGEFSELEDCITALGLNWNEDEVVNFVDPDFWG